jgi:hypothetical protein
MLAAVNIKWAKLRPDLRDREELHDELCAFLTDRLKLKEPLTSLRSLTDRQLYRSLDALSEMETQPALPHSEAKNEGGAEIIHLATAEQVFTINKLLDFLNWSAEARSRFIQERYRRTSPSMLTPKQAHALLMILLNIATARVLKERSGGTPVTRLMIRQEIPVLKARLGIDRRQSAGDVEVHV